MDKVGFLFYLFFLFTLNSDEGGLVNAFPVCKSNILLDGLVPSPSALLRRDGESIKIYSHWILVLVLFARRCDCHIHDCFSDKVTSCKMGSPIGTLLITTDLVAGVCRFAARFRKRPPRARVNNH